MAIGGPAQSHAPFFWPSGPHKVPEDGLEGLTTCDCRFWSSPQWQWNQFPRGARQALYVTRFPWAQASEGPKGLLLCIGAKAISVRSSVANEVMRQRGLSGAPCTQVKPTRAPRSKNFLNAKAESSRKDRTTKSLGRNRPLPWYPVHKPAPRRWHGDAMIQSGYCSASINSTDGSRRSCSFIWHFLGAFLLHSSSTTWAVSRAQSHKGAIDEKMPTGSHSGGVFYAEFFSRQVLCRL